jgi:hypothetical protein
MINVAICCDWKQIKCQSCVYISLLNVYIQIDCFGNKIYPKNTRRQNYSIIQSKNSRRTEKIDTLNTCMHDHSLSYLSTCI